LGHAVKWGLLAVNPAEKVVPPKVRRGEVRTWSAEEVRRFLEAAREDRHFALFLTAVYTGMRRGELFGLKWADIDLEARRLAVRRSVVVSKGRLLVQEPKTASAVRVLAIPAVVADALQEHRARQDDEKAFLGDEYRDEGWVFANLRGGPLDPANVTQRHFRAVVRKAGVTPVRFHDLRHTHATLLLRQGENPKVVAERLGHTTIAMTLNTYSHVLPDLQERAVERLAATLDPGLQELQTKNREVATTAAQAVEVANEIANEIPSNARE